MSGAGRRAAAILVAAGSGERLGSDGPKAFVELAGVPLVVRAARSLVASGVLDDLVVVVGEAHLGRARGALGAAGLRPVAVVAGGATRQASVARGLAALEQAGEAPEVVAVHDAARPLATGDLVARVLAAVVPPVVAAAPGLPVVDTLKRLEGRTVRTVDRGGLWAVQTPQVFDRATLEEAHRRAAGDATDDLALVEALERRTGEVVLVPGDRRNVKITYPDDLLLAEALLRVAAR